MEPQMNEVPMEEMGRGTDSAQVGGTMAHLSLGEVVIPRAFLDDPQVMEMLSALFQENGADLAEFTVGDPANKINPETGYPEFGFFKSLKKIFKIAAPLALSYFAPGIGSALGSSLLGAGAAGASTLGNALVGGGIGALTGGGSKGALLGGLTGGIGANLGSLSSNLQGPTQSGASLGSGSGILGAISKATGLSSNGLSSIGNLFGGASDTAGGKLVGQAYNSAGKLVNSAPSVGSSSSLGGLLSGVTGGGGSSFSNLAANAFGGYQEDNALKKQQEQLLDANRSQQANLNSFDPSGITEDPGYEFQRAEGQRALDSGLNAGGSLYSGKALKAASQYNQDYANNAFNDYYQRWLTKVQGQNSLTGAAGDVRANATGAKSQNIAQSLSNAIGAPVGQYGQGMTLEQLRRLGMAV